MTDRFYPIPAVAEPATVMPGMASRNIGDFHNALYQTSYTSVNKMETFIRSAFPPGYAGHQPGIREKFGYGSPGPEIGVLARPESQPGMKALEQTKKEDGLDALWAGTREKGAGTKKGLDMGLRTIPAVTRRSPLAARLNNPNVGHLENEAAKYFVPDSMSTWPQERVLRQSSSLSKLEKRRPLTPGFGAGTGFNTQKPGVGWWPPDTRSPMTGYNEAFRDKPYHPRTGFYPAVR